MENSAPNPVGKSPRELNDSKIDMDVNVNQVMLTAVTTGIVSAFSTTTTIVLMRYFPKLLDGVEKKIKKNGKE